MRRRAGSAYKLPHLLSLAASVLKLIPRAALAWPRIEGKFQNDSPQRSGFSSRGKSRNLWSTHK